MRTNHTTYWLLIGIFFISISSYSQIGTAMSQVNLEIRQILSLQISHPAVSIPMNLPAHYLNGNTTGLLNNHLKVNSANAYTIRVRTEQNTFSYQGGSSSLPVNTVHVQVASNGATGTTMYTPFGLSATDTDILQSSANEVNQNFNATYFIPSAKTKEFLNREQGNYTTTVIYTIIPQ